MFERSETLMRYFACSLQANARGSVQELKLSSNYITRIGQVALKEAVDMVYDMSGRVRVNPLSQLP